MQSKMTTKELTEVNGGAVNWLSPTSLNALSRGIGAIYDLGKALGSAIRYAISGKKC